MTAEELEPIVNPLIVQAGWTTEADLMTRRVWWRKLLDLLRVRARTTNDIVSQAKTYFGHVDIQPGTGEIVLTGFPTTVEVQPAYEREAIDKHWKNREEAADMLVMCRDRLAVLENWEAAEMEKALRALADERGISSGKIFQPLRVALVGKLASPGIFDVLVALDRKESLARLDRAVEFLKSPKA
jgi:glutamyl-tRNA synthetase